MSADDEPSVAPQPRKRSRRLRVIAITLVVLVAVVGGVLVGCWSMMIDMPGESFQGPLPPLQAKQSDLSDELLRDVSHLSVEIGERNLMRYPALNEAADYVEQQLSDAGYEVERQTYQVNGHACYNLEAEVVGTSNPSEVVVVGAHYDSVVGTPGANDNASGTAALLAIARALAGKSPGRTLRLVAFTNEEPPYFQTPDMGSWVYARRCSQQDDNIVAVLSLETIGYYRDETGSQQYPPPFSAFYPAEGNFIGIVGNVASRQLVYDVVESFRKHAEFPSEGGAVPGEIDGIGWSDHWSFWEHGYSGVMITDTAPFRYPYYHHPEDTPDKLDFDRMARVVDGLVGVVEDLSEIE